MSDGYRSVLVIETEVYSRVVGYFRPVQNWNKGKKQEFWDRKFLRPEEVTGARNLRIHESAGVREDEASPVVPAGNTITPVPIVRTEGRRSSAS